MATSTVLLVEDEPAIAELVSLHLRHSGYRVSLATSAQAAQASIDSELPTLVVLDWMLPGESGLSLAKRWRSQERTRQLPIIMLTARGEEQDLVSGLEAGADDYVSKPFSPKELMARIKAVLRRRSPQSLDEAVRVDKLLLDPATRRVMARPSDGSEQAVELKLGPTEFKLLHFLMSHPDRVHSRAQLLDRVWGDHVFIEERTVDVHIKRLREALGNAHCASMVETVRGAGYRLVRQMSATS